MSVSKNLSNSQVSESKIGVDWSRRSQKKGLFNGKCLYECLIRGPPKRFAFDGLLLTRGAVVATPFADAYSLTFRPVKSTDALAS
jgi:hypothetical protein